MKAWHLSRILLVAALALGLATGCKSSGSSSSDAEDTATTSTSDETSTTSAGFTVTTSSSVTSEGGSQASFTVVLNQAPTADVTIAMATSDSTEGSLSATSLTFTTSNWSSAQSVTVTGVDDSIVDGTQSYSITLSAATSDDAAYNGLDPSDVSLTNTDNDSQGFTISGLSSSLSEEATSGSFTIKLNSEPTADVTIAVSSNDTTEATLSPSSLTFTSSNWSTAQSVTVTGVNDYLVDGSQTVTITLAAASSSDSNYQGQDPTDQTVTVTDNDTYWTQQAYIKAANAGASDNFGGAVDISGDTLVVGAYSEDSNQTTITNGTTADTDNSVSSAGAVYVYKRASDYTWSQEAYIKASNGKQEFLGVDVSISGNSLAAGAHFDSSNQTSITNGSSSSTDTSSSYSGAVFVYTRSGTTWSQEAYIKAVNASASDRFGYRVDLAGDSLAVAAHYEASNQTTITNGSTASSDNSNSISGAVYIYTRSGSTWSQEAYIKAVNNRTNDGFGYSLALDGDTLAVGATGEDSNQTSITNGSTASSDDSASGAGAVYVYKRSGSSWSQEAYIKAPNAEAGDSFGNQLSLDGDSLIVTANTEDSAQTTITNGTTASSDNSASAAGAAYVFKRSGTTWAQEAYLKAPNADGSDDFGVATGISGDLAVVSAPEEASLQTSITNGSTASSDNSAAGTGAAYVFARSGSSWSAEAYLKASNIESGDQFGADVAVSGSTIVVSATSEDSSQTSITNGSSASSDNSASNAGAVYVFTKVR